MKEETWFEEMERRIPQNEVRTRRRRLSLYGSYAHDRGQVDFSGI